MAQGLRTSAHNAHSAEAPTNASHRRLALTSSGVVGALIAGLVMIPAAGGATLVSRSLVSDNFSRHVSNGLGAAAKGGRWSVQSRAAASVNVAGGQANFARVPQASSTAAWLPAAKARDVDSVLTFVLPAHAVQARGIYLAAVARRQADGRSYRVKLSFATTGRAAVAVTRTTARQVETDLATKTLQWSARAGGQVRIEIRTTGADPVQIAARAWPANAATPAWQTTVTDRSRSRLDGPGTVGTWGYHGRNSTVATWAMTAIRATAFTTARDASGLTAPAAPLPSSTSGQPDASNTGVPPKSRLTQRYGNWTIATPGTYSNLDIHGFVHIAAPNVTIVNSIIRGGVATGATGLLTIMATTSTNFVIRDSELVPEHPSVYIDGVTGWNYTALRVNIHGVVDGAKIFGDNATIRDSWIHDLTSYASDPAQHGGPSHGDSIQVLGGHNLKIIHNSLPGGNNAALQVTQTVMAVSALTFAHNWTGGGSCSVNLQDAPLAAMNGISVEDNNFWKTSTYNCSILAYAGVTYTDVDNTYIDGGGQVTRIRRAS